MQLTSLSTEAIFSCVFFKNNWIKKVLFIISVIVCHQSFSQVNLLDTSTWTVGTGSVSGFTSQGTNEENTRELGNTPFNNQAILWKASPDGVTSGENGGWKTSVIPIDNLKTYRFSVWMKKSNSFDGAAVLTAKVYDSSSNSAGLDLNGNSVSNASFEASDAPELDKWYLYIGYVHDSDYTGTSSIGGVYNPVTGNKILDSQDYKFSTTATAVRHRAYLYNGNTDDNLYFYAPTLYEVNGNEPTLQELIAGSNGNTSDTQAPTVPIGLTTTNINDTSVDLNWNVSTDNTAVTGYHIYNNGGSTPISSTTGLGTSATLNNLLSGTTYQLSIAAYDAAGNTSTPSSPAISVITTTGGGGTTSGNWNQNGTNINYTSGNVSVGTTTVPSGYKMAIDGKLITEEVKVQLSGEWADYVFLKDYQLPTLQEVEKHIQEKGHLINIPSAKEVETNGIELGEMNRLLLEKIEELTLYILEQKEELKIEKELDLKQEKQLKELKAHLQKIEKLIKIK